MSRKTGYFFLILLFILSGCASNTKGEENKLQVGIVWLSDNQSFQDMREGFMEELRSLGYGEDRLEFICEDAGGSTATLHNIINSMEDREIDLLVPLVTSATQAAVNQAGETPIIFISVTDPVGAGIMSSREVPDKNATGTCNEVPIKELFELAEKLTPGIETVGILYDPGLPNSVLTVDRAKEYFELTGITCMERAISGSNEVQAAVYALTEQVDAIYVPIDSTVLGAMPQVTQIARQEGIPVYGSAPSMVEYGALATVSVSERETGKQSAHLADQFFRGKKIEELPAFTVNNFMTVIHSGTAKDLGITVPQEVAAVAQLVGE